MDKFEAHGTSVQEPLAKERSSSPLLHTNMTSSHPAPGNRQSLRNGARASESDTQSQDERSTQESPSQQNNWHERSKRQNGFIDQESHQYTSMKDLPAGSFDQGAMHRTEVHSWPLTKRVFVAGTISLYT